MKYITLTLMPAYSIRIAGALRRSPSSVILAVALFAMACSDAGDSSSPESAASASSAPSPGAGGTPAEPGGAGIGMGPTTMPSDEGRGGAMAPPTSPSGGTPPASGTTGGAITADDGTTDDIASTDERADDTATLTDDADESAIGDDATTGDVLPFDLSPTDDGSNDGTADAGSLDDAAPDENGLGDSNTDDGTSDDATTDDDPLACSVQPANANANDRVKAILCYLYSIYGEFTLSGQQDCHWTNSEIGHINGLTGEHPAIIGGDALYDNAVSQALEYWNEGGLPMMRYHMGEPSGDDSYESSKCEGGLQCGSAQIQETLTPGTARNQVFTQRMDKAGDKLAQLQDAGVVVIWAPFHESQPNGWFWWSMGTGDDLKRLWQTMFEHYTSRGLNNLIWLMPFSGSPNAAFMPDARYVDLAGADTYATNPPFTNMFTATKSVVGDTMPIPLHETGLIPNPDDMFDGGNAPWVLFNAWCFDNLSGNSDQDIRHTYAHERVINRSDLPDFKSL